MSGVKIWTPGRANGRRSFGVLRKNFFEIVELLLLFIALLLPAGFSRADFGAHMLCPNAPIECVISRMLVLNQNALKALWATSNRFAFR
jgi:hypothetical protein